MLEIPYAPKEPTEEQIDIFKRRGSFSISFDTLNSYPREVMAVLSNVIVVRAENDFMSNSITYHGYSKYFDVLDDCCSELKYEWTLHSDEDGNVTIEKCQKQLFAAPTNIASVLKRISEELMK